MGGFPGGNHSSPAPWAPTGTPSPQDPHSQHGCLSAGHCWAALPGSGSPGAGAHWGRSAEGKNHKQQRQSGTKPARSVRNSREREPPQYQPRPYLQAHQSSHCLEKELQLFKTATGTRGRARPEKPHRERVPVGTSPAQIPLLLLPQVTSSWRGERATPACLLLLESGMSGSGHRDPCKSEIPLQFLFPTLTHCTASLNFPSHVLPF